MTLKLVTMGDLVADLIVPITQLPLRHQAHQIAQLLLEHGHTFFESLQ
jgi:hypothetical protein